MNYFGNSKKQHSANDDISRAIAKPIYAAMQTSKKMYSRGNKFLRGNKRGGRKTYKKKGKKGKKENGGCWSGGNRRRKRKTLRPLEKAGALMCFPGNSLVIMADESMKPISEIRLGDRVQSCRGPSFPTATVMFVPHAPNHEEHMFHRLTTESGRALRATELHYIPVRRSSVSSVCMQYVVRCKDVLVGDFVETLQGGWEKVVIHEKNVAGKGVYSFLTNEEFIMVDGIRASPFGYDLFSHEVYHQLFNILRFSYHWLPSLNQHPEKVLACEKMVDGWVRHSTKEIEMVSL